MKKIILFSVVLFGLALVWIIPKSFIPRVDGLEANFMKALANPVGSQLHLSQLTNFEWTTFCVFGGYSGKADAEQIMGAEWPYWWMWMNDNDRRMVFLNRDIVAASFDRTSLEMIGILDKDVCVGRSEAVVEITPAVFSVTQDTVNVFKLIGKVSE